jgi:UDP-N-acetyl-2-amino-2-deoxyglucuronate dehydrogenase
MAEQRHDLPPAMSLSVAIIGAGRRGAERGGRYGIAEAHAWAYERCEQTEMVAVADVDLNALEAFASEHRISGRYANYQSLLDAERPDLVSVCTWAALHPEIVVAAARAGAKGILCEKPMALTLREADLMLEACRESGTLLLVNHQRRLGAPFAAAKKLIDSNAIGELLRVEGHAASGSLYDSGTHWIDGMFYFVDDVPARWVMAQVDCIPPLVERGMQVENHAIVHVEFGGGVRGYFESGRPVRGQPPFRLLGSDGVVEILDTDMHDTQRSSVRANIRGEPHWQALPVTESIHTRQNFLRAVQGLVDAVQNNKDAVLGGQRARSTTEVLVAAYQSALTRSKVTLPAPIRDSPLENLTAVTRARVQAPARPAPFIE